MFLTTLKTISPLQTLLLAILTIFTITTTASPLPQLHPRALPPTLVPPPSSLPPPPSGLVLKRVLLGLGTQNYTCATSTTASAPKSNGALATLHDLSPLLLPVKPMTAVAALAPLVPPLALARAAESSYTTAASLLGLPSSGTHFFDAAGAPNFVLSGGAEVFRGKLQARTPAVVPAGGSAAPAVDWLILADAGGSRGSLVGGVVYRVWTAGGVVPASCEGLGKEVGVGYAAVYWVYGKPSGDDDDDD
ncbi:hypothetical protein W97_02573 [Coniosporium apollinis CBS 100218]|uniref:Malate dehydrogenase n=2 Tax=Coniosporium apollinis (strain CBS 100218) TaxID=1168221 RepID=R7YNV3_CONA1|nr:uncharacterized protein W97_02573 [Coniosporium apollinis CBS 100218]EON63346.1 hypothetical protein W97_02573 [Coniosporium apollinis CBS 100218]